MKDKILLLSLIVFFVVPLYAQACGNNSPEQLEKRSKDHFDQWDINNDHVLSLAEFLSTEGVGMPPDDKISSITNKMWVSYHERMLGRLEEFQTGDTDKNSSISLEEWKVIYPFQGYMLKGGC